MSNLGASLFAPRKPLVPQKPAALPAIDLPSAGLPPPSAAPVAPQQPATPVAQQPSVAPVTPQQPAAPDRLSIAKDNIIKMDAAGASEDEINQYLQENAITDAEIRGATATIPYDAPTTPDEDKAVVIDAVTKALDPGESPDAQLPEMSEAPIGFFESFGVNLKLGTTLDPVEKAKMLESHFKDDERFGGIFQTEAGNPMLVWEGKEYLINKPGVSQNDFVDILATVIQLLPAAKVTGMARTLMGRLVTGIPLFGATSAAQQAVVAGSGGKEGIDPNKTLTEGTLGGIVEAVTPPALRTGGRIVEAITPEPVKQAVKGAVDTAGDAIKATGRQLFPDTAAKAETIATLKKEGVDAQARGVRLTEGQANQDAVLLAKEQAAREGSKGGSAKKILDEFDDAQLADIQQQAKKLKEDLSGNPLIDAQSVKEIAGTLQERLIKARDASKQRVKALYDKMRNPAPGIEPARVLQDGLKLLNKDVQASLRQRGMTPSVLNKDANKFRRAFSKLTKAKRLNVTVLQELRSRMSALIPDGTPANGFSVSQAAMIDMKGSLDRFLGDAMERGLMTGDPVILKSFLDARNGFRKHANIFNSSGQDAGGKAMVKVLDESRASASEFSNWLVGVTSIADKAQAIGLVKRIKKAFPAKNGVDSDEVAMMKDAFITRLVLGTGENVSREQLIKQAMKVIGDTKNSIGNELFTKAERNRIATLMKDVRKTLPPKFDPKDANQLLERLQLIQRGNLLHAGGVALSPAEAARQVGKSAGSRINKVTAKNLTDHLNRLRTKPLVPAGAAALAFGHQDAIKEKAGKGAGFVSDVAKALAN